MVWLDPEALVVWELPALFVRLEGGLVRHPEAVSWLGDAERRVAWVLVNEAASDDA